ncbi:hypothetical protein N9C66_04970 [Akkermansiaceae bacterium]|nr:hypothetical protein [Akkermansiaceae bacterium]MDB4383208.1 hypothetical protein [Akkermansiaceae bacterium]
MRKIPISSLSFLALLSLSAGTSQAADLLGYYDFDNVGDPAIAPASGGIAPDAAITAPAAFSVDGGGHSGVAGDYALDLGVTANSGAFARVPAGQHFDLAEKSNAMAISFWQFNAGNGAGGYVASSAFWVDSPTAAADGRGFQAHVPWSDGTFYFDQSGCCGATQRLTTAGVITAGIWHHIVVQRDNLGNQEIWVDGAMVATAPGAEDLDPFSGIITIGANGGGVNNLTGLLDEFAVYSGVLTEAEIGQLSAGTANPSDIASAPEDADGDGLPDSWETAYGLSPSDDGSVDVNNGPDGDPDNDGLTNLEEFDAGLEPDNDDFDMDGLLDGVESNTGTYVDETDTGTDPKNADTDGDGLDDGVEDPSQTFVDANQPGTDPTKEDTDGDGFADLLEIENGSDPTDIDSTLGSDELTLLAYFNFDGQLTDQAGNTPDAVLGGTAALTTTGMGTTGSPGDEALELGLINDGAHAQTPAGTHLDQAFINNSMSVSFWQYRTADGSSSSFWIHSPTAANKQRGFQAHVPWGNGIIYFDQAGCCLGPTRLTIAAGGPVGSTLNTWQHFVFQRDAFGERQIWIDGVLAASAGGADPLLAFDGIITIGSEGPNLANSFAGRIDDFAIFANTLSPDQIAELANGANPPDLISPPVPFIITSIVRDDEAGRTAITWNSRANRTYAVDSSDDLFTWEEITDSVESEGESTSFTDFLETGTARRFYRIREVE